MVNNILFNQDNDLKLILKVTGTKCNIDCKYCFEKDKQVKKKFMDEVFLKNIFENATKKISITFHGGEPLLIGQNKFEELLNVCNKYKDKLKSVRIQTNGTLLNEDWCKLFFEKYKNLNIEIAISLDGNRKMNSLRLDYQGEETFDRVLSAYQLLKKWNKKAGMLSVISKESLSLYKEYNELIQSIDNLKFVKINSLFNVENDNLTKDSIKPMEFADFLINFFKIYIKTGTYKKIAVEPILSIIQKINNKPSKYCNYNFNKCLEFISVYPNGEIGPCDCFSINEFEMEKKENIEISRVNNYKNKKFEKIESLMSLCEECQIRDLCTGGCLAQRYLFRNNPKLTDDYCKAKMKLFEFFNEIKMEDFNE